MIGALVARLAGHACEPPSWTTRQAWRCPVCARRWAVRRSSNLTGHCWRPAPWPWRALGR